MCGIAGIKGGSGEYLSSRVKKMMSAIPHRGPDGQGYFVDREHRIGFGHCRLSILDTSSAGSQPMHNEDNSLVIIHNGEIYNYLEIKKNLTIKNHEFKTGTDTEVILAAYKEWGVDCLQHFNGMWAFAIFDRTKQQVFIARDRLGIKPLYYYPDPTGGLLFASEVKAILSGLDHRPEFEPVLIDKYMSFGYVPGENTLFKGIKRLLPGHYMMVDWQNNIQTHQYWDLRFSESRDRGKDYYLEKGKALLNNAIDLRLRSDVPLGIFLSGGLDSSAVVGLLAPRVETPLKTFSVAYDLGSEYNETSYARLVAKQFGTDHHEFFVTQKDFKDFIPQFVSYMDEPVTEAAAISLCFISKLAKDHVTVVLSGEGADEIFAGYDFYRYMSYIEAYRRFAGPRISGMIRMLGEKMFARGNKFRKYLCLGDLPLERRYKGISTYEESIKSQLYLDEFHKYVQENQKNEASVFIDSLFFNTRENHVLNRMLLFDTKTWLVDDLLIKADRMSMAASLELRVPFLDYRLVEFAASMPIKYKINKGNNKYLLKRMMQDTLPKAIINRKKMGFPTPLKIMFENQLADYSMDVLTSPSCKLHGYFKKETILNLLQEHIGRKRDHHRIIWQLIVLETWMQKWLTS